MNSSHPDYWLWAVLTLVKQHSCTAGEVCRQFDRAEALKRLIRDGCVDIFGIPFEEAHLRLTQRGIDYLKVLETIE